MKGLHARLVNAAVAAFAMAACAPALAQRAVSVSPNGIPVAPPGFTRPLPDGPFRYETAEGQGVEVTVLTRMAWPFSLAFLPNGDLLVTQRSGELKRIPRGSTQAVPVEGGLPSIFADKPVSGAVHGYMTVALHPRFEQNGYVYVSYIKALPDDRRGAAVFRARYLDGRLVDAKDIWTGDGLVRGAAMIALTPDARLWIATGSDTQAQDPMDLSGKVLRLDDDGSVPADNPFAGKPGWRPEIYTLGHRSVTGITVHPATGEVYIAEMGPNGGDEINRIVAGRNYGWPLVSLGRTYPGPWQSKSGEPTHSGYEPPVVYWTPSISVAGLTFYTGDALPLWKGDLFVAGLRYGEVPGTGRIDRVLLNEKMEELRRESLLLDLHQRIRDVKQGPDGALYATTDHADGAILRIGPAPAGRVARQ